jgi:hypothetical protein
MKPDSSPAGSPAATGLTTACVVLAGLFPITLWAQQAGPELQPLPHPELPPAPAPPVELAAWVYWVSGALALLLVGLIVWMMLRPRKASLGLAGTPPLKTALAALKALEKIAHTLPPAEVSHRVSVILRQYLEGRYGLPAPFRTSTELFSEDAPAPAATTAPRPGTAMMVRPRAQKFAQPFKDLADWWDELSFSPAPSTPGGARELLETARKRLEQEPAL